MKHTEFNPYTGATETWLWDDIKGFTIQEVVDVTDVLEANKAQRNASVDQRFGNEMLHHVAEIPNVFIEKFKREHGIDLFSMDPDQQKRLRRLLEDPEYRFLKTTVSKLWRPT